MLGNLLCVAFELYFSALNTSPDMNISALYVIFAVIATVANIVTQELATQLYTGPGYITFGMLCGTAIGLIIKYILDKQYIFHYQAESQAKDAQVFMVYSLMGVITTLIFWGTEIMFDEIFGNKIMRYTGAVFGLSIGYFIKYHLDRKFVFK